MSDEPKDRIESQEGQSHRSTAIDGISTQAPSPQTSESKRHFDPGIFVWNSALTEEPVSSSHNASSTKKIKISVNAGDKLASVNSAAAIDDSGDDSEVEFLFSLSSDQNESASNKYPNIDPDQAKSHDVISPEDTRIHPHSLYTYASSAYVQNLAEICYTIMHDVRWRTMENNTLFRWEQGDDLSIVKELCRYYEGNITTGCGLCRGHENESSETPFESHTDPQTKSESSPNSDEARAIHLYTRLFYRKGPWFRIDDIYKKYYAPQAKRATGAVDRSSDVDAKENKGRENSPQQQKALHTSKSTLSPNDTSSHVHLAEVHKQGIELLIADLCWLVTAGYIRGFESEEECGKTVGRSLLRSDERTFILSKLGVKAKAKGARSSSNGAVNEIWTQMQQQKSLWSHFQPKNAKKSSLLPVRKHVDEIIFQQVAKCLTESHGMDEHTRRITARSLGDDTMKHFRDTLRRSTKGAQVNDISGITCIRLREAPSKTLKRVVRLYLCATDGPGQMRGDGSNGWRSIEARDSLSDLPLSPSIDANWYRLSYPGLMVRFGRASAFFLRAFHHLRAEHVCADHKNSEQLSSLMIFHSSASFRNWEAVVELRANVDYLIELNERIRYNERKKERGDRISMPLPSLTDSNVDFIGILDRHVRKKFVWNFLAAHQVTSQVALDVICKIERDLDDSLPTVTLCCERVLHTIGLLCLHLLCLRHESITTCDLDRISMRPWLRHLNWESCLAYLLWDIFPYFERNNFYRLALMSLQVLVSGKVDEKLTLYSPHTPSPLALHLLSRRARGKAFDRIVIDFTHLTRKTTKTKDSTESQKESLSLLSDQVTSFTNAVIREASFSASISFGSIRTLAKRLRCPLSEIIAECIPIEANELGLRLDNDDCEPSSKRAYRDWSPITDRSVANAIVSEQSNSGRCSFVGHEDDGVLYTAGSSLNVEELAIECYKSGRLPVQSDDASIFGGGFHGWHDEGGRVRALFRILCSRTVLGMDWGGSLLLTKSSSFGNHYTVHLSPYQGAPFDLHVGHGTHATNTSFFSRRKEHIEPFLYRLQKLNSQEIADLVYDEVAARIDWSIRNKTSDPQLIRDILQLRTLSVLAAGFGGVQLAAIFRCLFFDYRYYSGGLPDLLLFRAIYEDSSVKGSLQLVELSEWIGEEFSQDRRAKIAENIGASFLLDRDDEFLGCSKTGDSAGQGVNTSRQGRASMEKIDSIDPSKMKPSKDMLPERLILSHGNRKVKIECMMVEVKSANDRLDPRQEDWLNILDRHGNARVCKFEKSSKVASTTKAVDPKYEE